MKFSNSVKFILFLLASFYFQGSLSYAQITNQALPFPGFENLSPENQDLANSLLGHALDHEALYTLIGTLKPMSSVGSFLSYPVAKDSSQLDGLTLVTDTSNLLVKKAVNELKDLNKIVKALSFGDYQFLLIPFRSAHNGNRYLEILVCRTDLFDSVLNAQSPFFAQWGFVPGTNPAVVITAIEFEEKNDRNRAYGYLFGYPDHAVDFFINANMYHDSTGIFVERNFFHVPVYSSKSGYFTFALPKDYEPNRQDSILYFRGRETLQKYKALRKQHLDENGHLKAIELYRSWWEQYQLTEKN